MPNENLSKFASKDEYERKYGFSTDAKYEEFGKGLNEEMIRKISLLKREPAWLLEKRLAAYGIFREKPLPKWGPDLSGLDLDDMYYYKVQKAGKEEDWDKVPDAIKDTFEKLGIPESERRFFAGADVQFDSSVVYLHVKEQLDKLGIIFMDMDTAVNEHGELVKKYFGTVIPASDNKFAALNTAVWSGGVFVYVPKGVTVPMPLNAYFRMNAKNFGQFERTLILIEEGAEATLIEGCTAPVYSENSLHAGVVEIIAMKGAKMKYVTVQNWSKNIYNLVTQRAHAYENAQMEWIDTNIGSGINMKYPSIILMGKGSSGKILSMALAGEGQMQDTGGKAIHLAPNTTSRIVSKSVSRGNGVATFRGTVHVGKDAENAKTSTSCGALMLDKNAVANTYPYIDVDRNDASVSHEARVGRIGEDEIFYLMSRGVTEEDAIAMIILGFIEDLTEILPMEYSLELKRLIKLDMAGSTA